MHRSRVACSVHNPLRPWLCRRSRRGRTACPVLAQLAPLPPFLCLVTTQCYASGPEQEERHDATGTKTGSCEMLEQSVRTTSVAVVSLIGRSPMSNWLSVGVPTL